MKKIWILLLLILMPLFSMAEAWEGSFHLGAGRPCGTGSDVFKIAMGSGVGLRYRLSNHFSMSAQHWGQALHLNRDSSVNENRGWATIFGLAPTFHLFPKSTWGSLQIAPFLGGYYEHAGAEYKGSGSSVKTLGFSYGGQIAYQKMIYKPFAIEIAANYVRALPRESCTSSAGATICEHNPTSSGNEGIFFVTVGVTFKIPTLPSFSSLRSL